MKFPEINVYYAGSCEFQVWDKHDNFLEDSSYEKLVSMFKAAPKMLFTLEAVNGVFKEMAQILHGQGYRTFQEEMNWMEEAIREAKGGK